MLTTKKHFLPLYISRTKSRKAFGILILSLFDNNRLAKVLLFLKLTKFFHFFMI